MSSYGQNLNEPHKCLKSKCKGRLDPNLEYGEWVYWHPKSGDTGLGAWMPNPPEGMTHDEVQVDKSSIHQ